MNTILQGGSTQVLKTLEDNSVDAIVTDPPYGLSFMGKKWDYDVPSVELWEEALRVLKPGGHLLAFAGTRTQHRMAVNIEDAGFEIRDMIAWVYGSGFPKSHNIGKAVDKLEGNEREEAGVYKRPDGSKPRENVEAKAIWGNADGNDQTITKGTSPWEGWGTALKPALEPITVAMKPKEGTYAENVLKWGVGGLNIDGSRVEYQSDADYRKNADFERVTNDSMFVGKGIAPKGKREGRFPANLIHDGSGEAIEGMGDKARYFYCPKASKAERNRGCEGMEDKASGGMSGTKDKSLKTGSGNERNNLNKNHHPTVKPIALMEYLINLVSRPEHTILDPFMGSGTTGIACKKLGRDFIGIEMEPEYIEIAEARMSVVQPQLI